MKNLYNLFFVSILSLNLSCAGFIKKTAIDSTGMIIEDVMKAFFEEEDIYFAKDAVPGNLKMLDGLIKGSPENEELLLMGTRFYASYAFGFLEKLHYSEEEEESAKISNARAKIFYKRALDLGLKLLKKNKGFTEALSMNTEDFSKYISTFDKEKVPQLFWTAYAWANLINLSKEDTDAIVNLGKVEAMMKRVLELDEKFFNGGPHMFYMVYYASRPVLLGGNPEKALFHYNKAKEITEGKFLFLDYIFAAHYCVQNQDIDLFKSTIDKLINTSADIYPEERLTNELAKHKASELLKLEEELF